VIDKVRQGVCELGLVGAPGPVSAPGVDVLPLEAGAPPHAIGLTDLLRVRRLGDDIGLPLG
jgi:hypothetical protein